MAKSSISRLDILRLLIRLRNIDARWTTDRAATNQMTIPFNKLPCFSFGWGQSEKVKFLLGLCSFVVLWNLFLFCVPVFMKVRLYIKFILSYFNHLIYNDKHLITKKKYVSWVAIQVIYSLFSDPFFVEKNEGIDMISIPCHFLCVKLDQKKTEQIICLTTKPVQWL